MGTNLEVVAVGGMADSSSMGLLGIDSIPVVAVEVRIGTLGTVEMMVPCLRIFWGICMLALARGISSRPTPRGLASGTTLRSPSSVYYSHPLGVFVRVPLPRACSGGLLTSH